MKVVRLPIQMRILITVVAFVFFQNTLAAVPVTDQAKQNVLVWFGDCNKPLLVVIELSFKSTQIYRTVAPVCKLPREAEPKDKILKFTFKDVHQSLFGEPRGEEIEGNIWEAGGDPGDVILGLTFSTGRREWLNTIAIAYPDKESTMELATGLSIKTYPISAASTKR